MYELSRATILALLTAFASPLSQMSLSPTYGSLPAAAYHAQIRLATSCIGLSIFGYFKFSSDAWTIKWTPIVASLIPMIYTTTAAYSDQLGPIYGPILTEFVTFVPLSVLSICTCLALCDVQRPYGRSWIWIAIAGFIWCLNSNRVNEEVGGWLSVFSPIMLQAVSGLALAILLPSRYSIAALALSFYTFFTNAHIRGNEGIVNATLAEQGFQILHRRNSVTGYLSVLENVNEGYRVMRCDHSLLGGIWTHNAGKAITHLREPVFAIFVVLEAVRLITMPSRGAVSDLHTEKDGQTALVVYVPCIELVY